MHFPPNACREFVHHVQATLCEALLDYVCKPNHLYWSIRIQGTCIEIRQHKKYSTIPAGSNRNEITMFSDSSRMRFLRFLNKVAWLYVGKCSFITVTYPDEISKLTYKERSKHRYLFLRHLERLTRKMIPTIWRCEWKERLSGALIGTRQPHFHFMAIDIPFVKAVAIREAWRSAIGYGPGPLMTDVKGITAHQGALRYLAKYVAKDCSLDIPAYRNSGEQIGRAWGVTRKHLIPMAPVTVLSKLSEKSLAAVNAAVNGKLRKYIPTVAAGFTLFGDEAKQILEKVINDIAEQGRID